MLLERLSSDDARWAIYALAEPVLDEDGKPVTDSDGVIEQRCPLLEQLEALLGTADADAAARIIELIKRASNLPNGPRDLRIEISHEMFSPTIDNESVRFWRLRQGALRVGFFYEAGRLIICTHCFVKRGDKVSKEEKLMAIESYRSYQKHFGIRREAK